MSVFLWIIIITSVAGIVGTGLGGVISAVIERDSDRFVSLLLSFAGGVMMSVVCFDLIYDALYPEGGRGDPNIWIVISGIIIGFVVVYLLNYWIDKQTNHEIKHIDKEHPKTADALDELIHFDHYNEHKKTQSNLFIAGLVMACAIALHNLPEGFVIGASYASEGGGEIFTGNGFVLAIVIGLHNIPEGMAVSVPLISGGMKRAKAVLVTALSGAPTVLGAMLGYWFGALGDIALTISLSFAGGAMLYVVFGELLPEAILMYKSKVPAFAVIIGILIGMIIIFA